jgi:hypothetical protein
MEDSEKAEIFRKIETYLTFLNIPQLERQGADIHSKVEEREPGLILGGQSFYLFSHSPLLSSLEP